ncbi:TIR domain-containing protein [Hymenobacter sp. GOD-10R]|uniref:nSTAND1 domain-containing NTPase n=1 Tax=Hymenobacter sp. GOD-10R TaxID=3093922 RepID=UPI002D789D2C|nr:TIR domain-containing protein [Hymenobacter sp. GOD-10R]WRQ28138.1 TIR domain-containing protein [Hymenobacter sp. GOD-10R]
MARIFISHASPDNVWAENIYAWLVENGWDKEDIFLDFDHRRGIAPGERWQEALQVAMGRCEVVIFLVSQAWEASKWCITEYLTSKMLGKKCIPVLIEPDASYSMLPLMKAEHQAVNLVTDKKGYERLKRGLLKAGIDANTFTHAPGRPPYPGLRALTEQDPAIFFGRDTQIIAALDTLRRIRDTGVQRMLVLLGASGCGKSSLMRAGLWPRLKRDDQNFLPLPVVRPARAVLSGEMGLYQALESALKDAALTGKLTDWCPQTRGSIRDYLDQEGSKGLVALLEVVTQAHQRLLLEPATEQDAVPTVVLFIDQLEELWSPDASEEATLFIELLGGTMETYTGLLVVTSIRSPSYGLLENEHRIPAGRQVLLRLEPMPEGSFGMVIEKPANLVGLELKPGLTDQLLLDAAGQDALPLLAFTLERLYREYGSDGNLTLNEYQRLGKISGAIESAAKGGLDKAAKEYSFASDDGKLHELLRKVFIPHLVRVDEQGEFIRRVALLSDIPADAHKLVYLLADEGQRLLVIDRLPGHRQLDTVEVSHEAVLRKWKLLNGWLLDEREHLIWRQRIEQAWADYQKTGSKEREGAFLEGILLETARRYPTWVAKLPQEWLVFVQQSMDADNARKRRQRVFAGTAISAAIAAIITFIFLIINQRKSEDTQQQLEHESRLNLSQFLASQANTFGQASPQTAVLFAAEALAVSLNKDELVSPQARKAANDALMTLDGKGYQGSLNHLVSNVVFNRDESLAAAIDDSGVIQVFDPNLPFPQALRYSIYVNAGSRLVAFSVDGTSIITYDERYKREGWQWPLTKGKPSQPVRIPGGALEAMAASDDGSLLAAATSNEVILYSLTDPKGLREISRFRKLVPDEVSILKLDMHANILFSGSRHSYVQAWRLNSAGLRLPVVCFDAKHSAVQQGTPTRVPIDIIDLSEDQTHLITASSSWVEGSDEADLAAKVWTLHDLHPVGTPRLLKHEQAISFAAFIDPGQTVVTTSLDGTMKRWSLPSAGPATMLATARHESDPTDVFRNIDAAALAPDRSFIATASSDEVIRLTSLSNAATKPVELRGFNTTSDFVKISRSGKWLVSGDIEGTLRLWNLKQGWPGSRAVAAGNWQISYKVSLLAESGSTAALLADDHLELWDLSKIGSPRQLPPLDEAIEVPNNYPTGKIRLSPDGRWLVAQPATCKDKSIVRSVDGAVTFTIQVRTWDENDNDFSPDSRWLLVNESTGAKTYLLAQAPYSIPLTASNGARAYFSEYSCVGGELWVYGHGSSMSGGSSDRVGYLWHIAHGQRQAQRYELGDLGTSYATGLFSPNGQWLGIPSDRIFHTPGKLVHLSQTVKGIHPLTLTRQEAASDMFVFSPNSQWLLTGTNDILTKSETRATIRNLRAPMLEPQVLPILTQYLRTAVFSPNGKFLVTVMGTDDFARLWHLNEAKGIFEPTGLLRGPVPTLNHYWEVIFNQQSNKVAITTTDDATPFLWFLAPEGSASAPVRLPTGALDLKQVLFAPDGDRLFALSSSSSSTGGNMSRGTQLLMFDVQAQGQNAASQEILTLAEGDIDGLQLTDGGKRVMLEGKLPYSRPVLDGNALFAQLGKAIGRNLTWDEWRRTSISGPYRKTFSALPVHPTVVKVLTDRVKTGEMTAPGDVPIDTLAGWALELNSPMLCGELASALAKGGEGRLSSRLIAQALAHWPDETSFRMTQQAVHALQRGK